MTRQATMRAEEKRFGTKRSGKRPELEGPWEGRGETEGVKMVKWEELSQTARKNRSRRAKRDDENRRRRTHGMRRQGRSARREEGGREESGRHAVPANPEPRSRVSGRGREESRRSAVSAIPEPRSLEQRVESEKRKMRGEVATPDRKRVG